jgi:hypothetical protein
VVSLKLPALPLAGNRHIYCSLAMDLSSTTLVTYLSVSVVTLFAGYFIMGLFGGNKFPVEGKVCSFDSS